jgi:hypothetical protein
VHGGPDRATAPDLGVHPDGYDLGEHFSSIIQIIGGVFAIDDITDLCSVNGRLILGLVLMGVFVANVLLRWTPMKYWYGVAVLFPIGFVIVCYL